MLSPSPSLGTIDEDSHNESGRFILGGGKTRGRMRGTLMESLLSSLPAGAVMKPREVKAFETLRPRLWARYVDTLVVLEKAKLNEWHKLLNTTVQ